MLAVEVLVALVVGGLGVGVDVLLGDIAAHPVEHLATARGVVAHELLVGVAAILAHVLVEDVHRVDLGRALVEEQHGVVAGHVAGVLVVLALGLGLGKDGGQAGLLAAQGGQGTGVAGADH